MKKRFSAGLTSIVLAAIIAMTTVCAGMTYADDSQTLTVEIVDESGNIAAYDGQVVLTQIVTSEEIEEAEEALEEAEAALEEAQEEYSETSYGFFCWLSEYDGVTSAQQSEAATAAALLDGTYSGSITTNRFSSTGITYSDLLDTLTIGEGVTTLDNFIVAINMVTTCNELRTTDDNFTGLSTLKISPILMAVSELQTSYSTSVIMHTSVFNVGENLAWGQSSIAGAYYSWYTAEKADYDAGDSSSAGHYLNIVSSSYAVTGTAYTNVRVLYSTTWGQVFNASSSGFGTTANAYTPEELLALVEKYTEERESVLADLEADVEEAEETLDSLKNPFTGTYEITDGTADTGETGLSGNFTAVVSGLSGHTSYTTQIAISASDSAAEISMTSDLITAIFTHTYTSAVTEPTCTQDGYTAYTCSVCGDYYTVAITALGHDYEAVVTDPTCTQDGYTTYTCTRCGDSYTADETDALGHSFGEWEIIVSAACETEGSMQRTCTVCGYTETQSIAATGHDWEDSYTVDVEATCETDGSQSIHCKNCDAVKDSEVIPATGHSYEGVVTTEPTCTEEGVMTYTCSVCGKSYTESIAATGHTYEGEITEEATCTESGEIVYTCIYGDDSYTEVIPATGHSYVSTVTIEPTCTDEGVMTYTCSVCGDSYTESIAATGHTYEAGEFEWNNDCSAATLTFTCSVCGDVQVVEAEITTQTTEPTCTEAGSIVKTASVEFEGITYTDAQTTTLDMIDHTAVSADNAVEATCGTDGKEADTICAVCGEVLEEGAVIPATGEHNYESVVTKQATTTEEGETTYTCTVCGDTYTETIPVLEEETTTAPETTEETTTSPESTEETTTAPETTEETTTTPESTEETTTSPETTEETTTAPESTEETTTSPESTEETTTSPETTESETTAQETETESLAGEETQAGTETEAAAADEETTEEAADEDTSESPTTGDSNSFAVWACMGMLAALALAFTAIRRRID